MSPASVLRSAARLGLAAAIGVLLAPRAGADGSLPGAYCPIPEPGEKPACLEAARHSYPAFLASADAGDIDDEAARLLEADLQTERVYLALSSLAYGYYRLAEHVAAQPSSDPRLVARLEHWNQLLTRLYEGGSPEVQRAVLDATRDLEQRTPENPKRREAATVAPAPTGARSPANIGIRGALGRLVDRLRGPSE